MKKWYKKHLDELKAADKKSAPKKGAKHSFDATKLKTSKRVFPDPVAASKLQRPKTFLP